jgi:mannose-6-phosphate isomerase-like protein (cupin superfamily)
MSAYTALNLLELDDVVGNRAPGIEGRFARSKMESRDLGVSHFRYGPGVRSKSAHTHTEQEEVYVVLEGAGRIRLDDEIVDIKPFDLVRVAPGVVRAIEAGPDGLTYLAIGGPRPEEGDGKLVDSPWPEG